MFLFYPRHRSKVVLFSAECVCLKLLLFFRFDSIAIQLSRTYMHLVEVCVDVCPHDNLKTIADICFVVT